MVYQHGSRAFTTVRGDGMNAREEYQWYKEHGICVKCHSEEAEPGRVKCFECADKQRLRDSKRVRSSKDRARDARERYEKRKSEGTCLRCEKKATHGVHCYEHYIYMRRRNKNRTKGFGEIGLCRICGAEPEPGFKLCPLHRKEYADRMIKQNKERSEHKNEIKNNPR